jgi:hypothetical protein
MVTNAALQDASGFDFASENPRSGMVRWSGYPMLSARRGW